MLHILFLFLLFGCVQISLQQCSPPGEVDNLHNFVRQAVARRYAPSLSDPSGANITLGGKGSKTLFALTYDCTLEGIAIASIDATKCKLNKKYASALNKAVNFATNREKSVKNAYLYAVEEWLDTAELPISATYNPSDPASESFANNGTLTEDLRHMVYYKSLKLGCARIACTGSTTGKFAIACAYGAIPQKGQPLYIEAGTKKGCVQKMCRELVSNAICQNEDDGDVKCSTYADCGLCYTMDGPDSLEESTTSSVSTATSSSQAVSSTSSQESTLKSSSTAAASSSSRTASSSSPAASSSSRTASSSSPKVSSSSPTSPSPTASSSSRTASTSAKVFSTKVPTTTSSPGGCMTDDIRNQVVNKLNEKRALLAKGQVQNGPASSGKGNLLSATNMYKMGYDTGLESEAQNYTNTCPPKPGKSDLSTRTGHGETTMILDDKSISCADALTKALEAWWNEITKKALNSAVKYTQVLEQSVNAPTNFTQMAWAASYKVGCGVSQCDYGAIVVCRYYVRGNIYSQYIYRTGTNCAACSTSCSNGLCKAPN